jgi:hypothetical protein
MAVSCFVYIWTLARIHRTMKKFEVDLNQKIMLIFVLVFCGLAGSNASIALVAIR